MLDKGIFKSLDGKINEKNYKSFRFWKTYHYTFPAFSVFSWLSSSYRARPQRYRVRTTE